MAEAFCRVVDRVNEWTGRVVSLAFVPLAAVVMTEVVLRYFFNSPTIWAWDILIMLTVLLVILGVGTTLLYRGHVIVDVVAGRFTPRVRAIVDMITSSLFFFGIGALLWYAIREARRSVLMEELLTGIWMPPLYPLRIVVAIGLFLLLIQGISKFIRDLRIARGSEKESVS